MNQALLGWMCDEPIKIRFEGQVPLRFDEVIIGCARHSGSNIPERFIS